MYRPDARRQMFQLYVGDMPTQLTQGDYRTLADKTDGYSGSDISTAVRDGLLNPVRKIISATHFKRVADPASDSDSELTKLTPCLPGDPAAEEMQWRTIEPARVLKPPIRLADFLEALSAMGPTVTANEIRQCEDWAKEFGTFVLLCLSVFSNLPLGDE
ncbi:hypothetical protein C0991_011200 [Blastosporella zonata]|nr:hypothetical protein C0991_011200 [Blastosporella zonata]